MALNDCIEKALKARKINGAIAALNTQFNDALIESYRAEKRTLDNLLEGDRWVPEIGCQS